MRYLGPNRPQSHLVGAFSHSDQLTASHAVAKAASPSPLARAAADSGLSYQFRGRTGTIPDYLSRHPATGLLILIDELAERYAPATLRARAITTAECTALRPPRSLIWWRHEVPSAMMMSSAPAARTAGNKPASAMAREASWLSDW